MQNKKIVDYRIVAVVAEGKKDDDVTRLLQSGFQPWGNPCSPVGTGFSLPLQAFVKYEG